MAKIIFSSEIKIMVFWNFKKYNYKTRKQSGLLAWLVVRENEISGELGIWNSN